MTQQSDSWDSLFRQTVGTALGTFGTALGGTPIQNKGEDERREQERDRFDWRIIAAVAGVVVLGVVVLPRLTR